MSKIKFHTIRLSFTSVAGCVLLAGCPATEQGATTTQTIVAAAGGTIVTSGGVLLDIPAGALPADTEITVTTLSSAALTAVDGAFVAGVILEPDGLSLSAPATLRVPLPAPWSSDSPPVELFFKGDSPGLAVPTGALVSLSDDRTTALFEITHFSGRICANNCHEGVREFLASSFASRGCAQDTWQARVVGRYPGLVFEACDKINADVIQCVLDTFFDDFGGWDGGVDIPDEQLQQLAQYAEQGRHVVFTFGKDRIAARSGARQFYGLVAHSAIVEKKDGIWQLRNAFVPDNLSRELAAIDYTNLIWWPLSNVNNFRNLANSVALELAVCGTPGCLGSSNPLLGETHPLLPLEQRLVPWNAVHVYVERAQNAPCNRLSGCWRFETSAADGSPGTLLVRFDQEGSVLSVHFSNVEEGHDGQPDVEVFTEVFRFAAPNATPIQDAIESLDEVVELSADQTAFHAEFHVEMGSRDSNGALTSKTGYYFSFTDAHFSANEPDEYFDATYTLLTRFTTYDENGAPQVSEQSFSAPIRAWLVPCPTVAEGTLITQEQLVEQLGDDIDFNLDFCGAGAISTAPLTMLGLAAMRRTSTGARRRRC